MEKLQWFLKGVFVSAWVIGFWILGGPVLGYDVGTAYLVGIAALIWFSWRIVEETTVQFGVIAGLLGLIIGFFVSPVAVVLLASIVYGLDHNERSPWGADRASVRTFATALPSVVAFALTIGLGWQTALIATGIMLIVQLVLLYLPAQDRAQNPV